MIDKKQLVEIVDKVRILIGESRTATPGRLSELLVELTSYSATLSEELDDVLIFKADRLADLREQYKTVKETEWAWKASPDGKKEIYLKGWLQRIKDSKSAIKSRLQIAHDEAFGQY